MRPSRRAIMWAFAAFALAAVLVAMGGLLREGAILVLLVLGGYFLADIYLSRPGPLTIETTAPAEVFTGETATVTLRALDAGALDVRIDWPPGLAGPADATLMPEDGGDAVARLPVTAKRRGQWRVERAWFTWPSRFGLLDYTPKVDLDLNIAVVPNIRVVQSGAIDVKVRSTLFGIKETLAIGEGSEFHQLREFASGMDVRAIDWKRSARHRQLLAKEMRAERNHHVILALDNGHLMREEVAGLPRIDHAVNAALAVAWAAGLGGDRVGLFAFDAEPRLFLPPEPGRRAFARIRSRTAELAYTSVESNHTLALSALMSRTPRRSLIVVFSDFVDATTAELLVENTAMLARRHVVLFVALRDAGLDALTAEAPDGLDAVARSVTAAQMLRERRLVMERLSRLGVMVLDVPPASLTARLVSAYLEIKAREFL